MESLWCHQSSYAGEDRTEKEKIYGDNYGSVRSTRANSKKEDKVGQSVDLAELGTRVKPEEKLKGV